MHRTNQIIIIYNAYSDGDIIIFSVKKKKCNISGIECLSSLLRIEIPISFCNKNENVLMNLPFFI